MSSAFGTLIMIVRRSMRQHALSTAVTVASTAMGAGLVMSVFTVAEESQAAFESGDDGFDAVLGARGSQLQLVLNTVFHLETSPGNLPWAIYKEVQANPGVELAVPYAVGDNYKGYRIVGTTAELFTGFKADPEDDEGGQRFDLYPGGRYFDPELREAVVGSMVAIETGLRVGDHFQPYHGVAYNEKDQHEEEYLITGILEPTSTPSDRVIWIPIEGIYRMGGHVLRGTGDQYEAEAGEEIADEHKEVSAVMLKFKSPRVGMRLSHTYNLQGKVATLAFPIATVMGDIFRKLGWMILVLRAVAYLVVVVAAGSILASIYNTMNERRREFAILRALGARRRTVFGVIVLESTVIATLGALFGFVVYAIILNAAATIIRDQTGVVLTLNEVHPALYFTPLGMIVMGALAGILPAIRAYSTDVADTLSHS